MNNDVTPMKPFNAPDISSMIKSWGEATHVATLGDYTKHKVILITAQHFPPNFFVVRRCDTGQVLRVHRDNLKKVQEETVKQ